MAWTTSCNTFTWFVLLFFGFLFVVAKSIGSNDQSPTSAVERVVGLPAGAAGPIESRIESSGRLTETGPGCGRTRVRETDIPGLEAIRPAVRGSDREDSAESAGSSATGGKLRPFPRRLPDPGCVAGRDVTRNDQRPDGMVGVQPAERIDQEFIAIFGVRPGSPLPTESKPLMRYPITFPISSSLLLALDQPQSGRLHERGAVQRAPRRRQRQPRVSVSYPVERDVTNYADFTGRFEAVYSVEVRARVTGYLDRGLLQGRQGGQ